MSAGKPEQSMPTLPPTPVLDPDLPEADTETSMCALVFYVMEGAGRPGAQVGVVGSETGEGRGEKEANIGYFLEWLPLWAAAFIVLVSLGDGTGYTSQVSQTRGKGAGGSILQPLPAPGCQAYGFCLFWVTTRPFPFPSLIQW